MKRLSYKYKWLQRSIAAATFSFLMTEGSFAQSVGVGKVFDTVGDQSTGMPTLMNSAAYITGIGLVIAGLIKIKEYVDDPDRALMRVALIRLGAGASFVLLPWFIDMIMDTLGADGNDISIGDGDRVMKLY